MDKFINETLVRGIIIALILFSIMVIGFFYNIKTIDDKCPMKQVACYDENYHKIIGAVCESQVDYCVSTVNVIGFLVASMAMSLLFGFMLAFIMEINTW
jgi:hypothetical protein